MKLRLEGNVLSKMVDTILLHLIICNQFHNTVSALNYRTDWVGDIEK